MTSNETSRRFIRRHEVLSRTGLGKSTLYRLMRAGQFPRSFLLTPRLAVWNESQVALWMSRRCGHDAKPAPFPRRKPRDLAAVEETDHAAR
jgi:prophage regulatory protein